MAECLNCGIRDVDIDYLLLAISPPTNIPTEEWCINPDPSTSQYVFCCRECTSPIKARLMNALTLHAYIPDSGVGHALIRTNFPPAGERIPAPNCRCNFCSGQR